MSDCLKGLAIIAVLVVLGWMIADIAGGSTERHLGVIVGRSFTPSQSHVNVGVDDRGRTVTSISTTAERFTIVVRDEHGAHPITTTAELWAAARDDMVVPVRYRVGRWTGVLWSESLDGWPQPAAAEAP